MDFSLGTTCWHVVGYSGDQWVPSLLCRARPDPDYAIGGSALDVIASLMPICGNCDRITHGEARRYVTEVERESMRRIGAAIEAVAR